MKKKIFVFLSLFLIGPLFSDDAKPLLSFSGYNWIVKESRLPVGPGPNPFARENVQIFPDSSLLLSITRPEEKWSSGELFTEMSFTYGEFSLIVSVPPSLDSRIVFGFFLYNEQVPPFFNEIDFEISSWGRPVENSFQFTLQPYQKEGNLYSFPFHPPEEPVTVRIRWLPESVAFSIENSQGSILREWEYNGPDRPTETTCRVHLNLWLFEGALPQGDGEKSIRIHRFTYEPLKKN